MTFEGRKRRAITAFGLLAAIVAAGPGLPAARAANGNPTVAESRGWDGIDLAPLVAFERATLIVAGPEGYRAKQSYGAGELPAIDALELADGDYRYELRLLVAAGDGGEPAVERTSGKFTVAGGQLVQAAGSDARPGAITNDQVFKENLIVQGDACVGGPACVDGLDFTNAFGNADIIAIDSDPQIFLSDTDENEAGFAIEVDANEFNIFSDAFNFNRRVFGIDDLAGTDSIFVAPGGVGLGTAVPNADLHISSFSASLLLESTGADQGFAASVFSSDGRLAIREAGAFEDIFVIEPGTGNETLVLDSNSRVGIGTSDPASTLEVTKDDGSTRVLVEETSATVGNRTLVQLTNNGRAQVRLSNTASGVNWVTGMGTDDAYIIRRGANEYRFTKGGRVRWFVGGDPTPRFDYSNNGNLKIAGTLTENSDAGAKRDIEPVDGAAVLERVAALPVSTWSYRDDEAGARHVGPMAQDFHAAFGLGADDTSLSPRDVAGVALAAVKELLYQKDAEIAALRAQQSALLKRLESLEARLGN